eukprot:scaffold5333_cov95-Skeletonema_dohrnii-CCMP3373.AAC.6
MLLYYHGQLEWVTGSCRLSYSQREIRYGCQQRSWRPSQMPHQVTYDVVARLRRANINGPLEAVDCRTHIVRYDMLVDYVPSESKFDLIRSPTML